MLNLGIHLFLYLLAGITFTFAAFNLTIGLQKGSERTYTVLGIMGVCVGIYYILFPQMTFLSPLPFITKAGFFFFLASFALLPWFFCNYTGYCKSRVQWLLSIGMLISYLLLVFSSGFSNISLWNVLAHIILIGIISFGFFGAFYQIRKGQKWSAWLLITALFILSLLTIDDIIRVHFNTIYPFRISSKILPLDYFLVLFMIIMGLKLARDMQRKYYLEKSFNVQEKRWKNLLEKVELFVVGLNNDGTIYYVNPYFLKACKYSKEEVLEKNWFNNFLPSTDRQNVIDVFEKSLQKDVPSHFQNCIKAGDGNLLSVSWSNVVIENEQGRVTSSLSIGSDKTEQEAAFKEIKKLTGKLEEENILLKAELGKQATSRTIIGDSDALRYVLHRALQVAPTDSTVLLEGETGVGKELVANYIQENSHLADKPFIKLNCAAIPGTLLESELFGHTKGAFTGADKAKKGIVEMVNGGTLFLDEIGEFPMELQPKLLRFLQEGEYQSLGSEVPKKVNVRIIAATNKELLKEIDKGRFRNDLYYRLYVYPITVPSLRSRKEDIPELVDYFVNHFSTRFRKSIKKVSKLVIEELQKYAWPGNIRELENILERAVIVSTSDTIKIKNLSPEIINRKILNANSLESISTLEVVEREHIAKALKATNWQVHGNKGAAELLGMNPSTLRSRIKKLGINKP